MSRFCKVLMCAASIMSISAVGFADDAAVQPDNSKTNQRDRSVSEVTSQDQGTSKSDISTTRKIRQAVVRQKAFSSDAKNIKILSNPGYQVFWDKADQNPCKL